MTRNLPVTEPSPCLTGDLRTPGKRRAPQRRMLALKAAAPGSYPSPNYSSRNGTKVTGACIHSAEGPTDATALGAYFAQASVQVSSHAGADDSKRVNYVNPAYEAWTLRNGNPWTDNLEMCARAAWTRAEWLAHPGMLQQAAEWVAERCHARSIPPVRITAADIKAGRRTGYFAHWDYTLGTGDGSHWDVGTGFPWDVFDQLVQAAYNPTPAPQEDDTVKYLVYRSDPAQKDEQGKAGTGEIVLAAPGQWYHIPSPAYLQLCQTMQMAGDVINVAPNIFGYLQTVFMEPEFNDEAAAAAIAAVKAEVDKLANA